MIQRNSCSVADGAEEFTSQEYEGRFNLTRYDADDTYCTNREKLLKVAIGINFYDFETFDDFETHEFEELKLRREAYKNGYIAFKTENFNPYGKRPYLIIGLNKKRGVKEKIEDLFIKSKIFNHKQLAIRIGYDGELIQDIKYEHFLTYKDNINLVPITGIELEADFKLD